MTTIGDYLDSIRVTLAYCLDDIDKTGQSADEAEGVDLSDIRKRVSDAHEEVVKVISILGVQ